jgi:hypothetical protein
MLLFRVNRWEPLRDSSSWLQQCLDGPAFVHNDGQDQDDGESLDEGEQAPPADPKRQSAGGTLRRYTTRWRWFGYGRSSS